MEEEKKTQIANTDLQEESRMTEEPLGYPLNIMCTLYYESGSGEE